MKWLGSGTRVCTGSGGFRPGWHPTTAAAVVGSTRQRRSERRRTRLSAIGAGAWLICSDPPIRSPDPGEPPPLSPVGLRDDLKTAAEDIEAPGSARPPTAAVAELRYDRSSRRDKTMAAEEAEALAKHSLDAKSAGLVAKTW